MDSDGLPVSGATVTGDFSGPTSGSEEGTTNGNGVVEFSSSSTRSATADWCFAVTNVSASGFVYNSALNVETSDCGGSGAVNRFDLANHPNPFNPTTSISFSLSKSMEVRLEIYNINGQKISTLVDGYLGVGEHNYEFDGNSFATGMYLYRLITNQEVVTKKMLLVK